MVSGIMAVVGLGRIFAGVFGGAIGQQRSMRERGYS